MKIAQQLSGCGRIVFENGLVEKLLEENQNLIYKKKKIALLL